MIKNDVLVTSVINMENSIMDSIAKIKSSGASENEITSMTDNAYNNFVKYVKIYAPGMAEKVMNIAQYLISY